MEFPITAFYCNEYNSDEKKQVYKDVAFRNSNDCSQNLTQTSLKMTLMLNNALNIIMLKYDDTKKHLRIQHLLYFYFASYQFKNYMLIAAN